MAMQARRRAPLAIVRYTIRKQRQRWRTPGMGMPPVSLSLQIDEGSALHYAVHREGEHLEFSVTRNGKETRSANVSAMVGGKRHGLSFLIEMDQIDGMPLARRALLEGRYASSRLGTLILSPGFLKATPGDEEDTLGRVLSPTFEQRCLTCHGQPNTLGAGSQGGVRCESCHGPSAAHVNSLKSGSKDSRMVMPSTLKDERGITICTQCHNGLTTATHSDAMPEDLLVSNQVPALERSECFIQSRGKLTCTACHNPHEDSTAVVQTSVSVCLRCHSLTITEHASICPVNRTNGCVACHMPAVDSDTFHLTDHWIRAVPPAGSRTKPLEGSLRSQVLPEREFLRLIVVENADAMKAVTERLEKGESFSSVAHDLSIDGTAPGGGYLGETKLAEMDPKLAAVVSHLPYGGRSDAVEAGNRWIIFQRLPLDFRWEANRFFHEAAALKDSGNLAGAVKLNKQALQEYPYFLRALVLMATMLEQAGNPSRTEEVLRFAVQSYPKDAMTHFDLAMTVANRPTEQIEELRRTIELDPDMVAAYQSLGAALFSAGQTDGAIQTFRDGLKIDPLSAFLYYDLGLALQKAGDPSEAQKSLALAAKLDPQIAVRKAP